MRVAVVVVAHGAGPHLDRTLAALGQQTVKPARVIVVDNRGDMSRYQAHGHVELVRPERNLGFAAGNNLAVRMADDCDWIALLNPDAFPDPRWLETLLDAARANPEFSFFGSRLVMADGTGRLDGTGDVYHVSGMAWRRDYGRPFAAGEARAEEIFSPCAAAALYRREAFLAVGGFDESFFCYFEDSDLAFRLRLAGSRCLYVPEAVVHHVGSATSGFESDFTLFHSFRNYTWAYVKNMPSPLLWLYLPQHLLVHLLVLASYAVRGRAGVILRAQAAALLGLPRVLRERRRVQPDRVVSLRELRRSMATGTAVYRISFERFRERWLTRAATAS
jgi:GT2 family glycosyltransferase